MGRWQISSYEPRNDALFGPNGFYGPQIGLKNNIQAADAGGLQVTWDFDGSTSPIVAPPLEPIGHRTGSPPPLGP